MTMLNYGQAYIHTNSTNEAKALDLHIVLIIWAINIKFNLH